MSLYEKFASCVALFCCGVALPALAASTVGSSASDSASSTASSASDSLKTSSGSSKGNNVAQGDYKIIDLAAAAERPGSLRLKLQALADPNESGELLLYIPVRLISRGDLAVGQLITARTRPYGIEFAKGEPREAFFLVLHDDVYRELNSVAVSL